MIMGTPLASLQLATKMGNSLPTGRSDIDKSIGPTQVGWNEIVIILNPH